MKQSGLGFSWAENKLGRRVDTQDHQEAIAIIHVGDNEYLDQGGGAGGGEEWQK